MKYCWAADCKESDREKTDVTFHSFPKDLHQRQLWIEATGRSCKPGKTAVICSKHFTVKDFKCNSKNARLNRDVVPSRFNNAAANKQDEQQIQDSQSLTESAPEGDNLNKELVVVQRNRYTFEEKKKILEECKTLNSRELCVKYGLNKSVLSKWRSNEEIIKNAAKTSHTKALKKVSETNELNVELFTWLSDCRSKGIPVSGPMLCRQALVINSRIGGPENFKASHGWLEKWRRRTHIENLKITDLKVEKLSADEEAANLFEAEFAEMVAEKRDPTSTMGMAGATFPIQAYDSDNSSLSENLSSPNKRVMEGVNLVSGKRIWRPAHLKQVTSEHLSSPWKRAKYWGKAMDEISALKKKVKVLQEDKRRMTKKIKTLNDMIKHLKDK